MIGLPKPKHPKLGGKVQTLAVNVADECASDVNAGILKQVLVAPVLTKILSSGAKDTTQGC